MDLSYEKNRIFAKTDNEQLVAEITFPLCAPGVVNINRTFVDNSLRGQGIADLLVREAISQIRKDDCKAKVTCSYVKKWFAQNSDECDILEND